MRAPLLQRLLPAKHPSIAHRLVFGGVGAQLGAVQADVAEAYQPGFVAEPQDLDEEPPGLLRKAFTELRDGVEVGPRPPGQVDEGDLTAAGPGQGSV